MQTHSISMEETMYTIGQYILEKENLKLFFILSTKKKNVLEVSNNIFNTNGVRIQNYWNDFKKGLKV